MSAGAEREPSGATGVRGSALFVDLYELTMGASYVAEGLAERPAVFQLYARSLPPRWGAFVAAGLDEVLTALEGWSFGDDELAYLDGLGLFDAAYLEHLGRLRFSGDVRAVPEGTVAFPGEPLLELSAPLLEAQLLETVLLNIVHLDTLLASKAMRCVTAARGRRLVEFGARRAHGEDAALRAARASYLAGFDATSDVLAGRRFGIPLAGTMAHSYVESFANEEEAFAAFVRTFPDGTTLLIDTYDTLEGARRAALVARSLEGTGRVGAVRLDSGDLLELAPRVRALLDAEGASGVGLFASGGLDEDSIAALVDGGAPIDGFGVGSRLVTAADCPVLDMAYKLVELAGRPVLKLSTGKATLPCAKQVWRTREDGVLAGDVIALAEEPAPGPGAEPLLVPVVEGGRRLWSASLEEARARHAAQRTALPPVVASLDAGPYAVRVSARLAEEAERAGARASAPSPRSSAAARRSA